MLSASAAESSSKRAFTCQGVRALVQDGLPGSCYLNHHEDSEGVRAALNRLAEVSKSHKGVRGQEQAKRRTALLMEYIREIGAGEPPVRWYREKLKAYPTVLISSTLSPLPYWQSDKLRMKSLAGLRSIDKRVETLRADTNDALADLLAGYVESYFELMEFGFEHDLYGDANPVQLRTLLSRTYKIASYLDWLHKRGHETLQTASRSVLDEYIAEKNLYSAAIYDISMFYDWVRKKHRFVPKINYNRKGKPKQSNEFEVLSLEQSQTAYARICEYPEPQIRALALLALLYAQPIENSLTLTRSELVRDDETGRWIIARSELEPFLVEQELSEALDECLAWADSKREKLTWNTEYLFPSTRYGHISPIVARRKVLEASGVKPNVLRRTAIINMYRSGQKTMGTVVLRDVLNVSSQTIRRAIRMTGESVNAPLAKEEAEAMRQAFLEDDV